MSPRLATAAVIALAATTTAIVVVPPVVRLARFTIAIKRAVRSPIIQAFLDK